MSQNTEPMCFIIMPFRKELHYFFLFMKQHITEVHGINCFRGDEDVLTVPLLDKIHEYIKNADVIIADCSCHNANVFYELGMAHTLGKKVILITGDELDKEPADVQFYEFIQYELAKDKEFLSLLDKALRKVFEGRYDDLFQQAISVYDEFKRATNSRARKAEKDLFVERVIQAKRQGAMPEPQEKSRMRGFLLLKILSDKDDEEVISQIDQFLKIDIFPTFLPEFPHS